MKRKPVFKAIPVRVTPLAAAVASALGSISGVALATDEITVTASRRAENLQELPYSVSAISSADIQALQLTDLSGIARWTPGLIQVDQGARDGSRLIIRGMNISGIDSPETLLNSSGGRVATYYGETPVYLDLKLIDVERIEVLRGPQGTLYGANSLGGAVRYITADPDLEEFSIDAHARGYDTKESSDLGYEVDAVINVPLIQDTLALRALLGYSDEAGYIDYKYVVPNPGVSCPEPGYSDPECSDDGFKNKKDVNDVETTSAGLSLLWNISDVLDAQLGWRYQDQEIGGRNISSKASLELIEQNRNINLDTGDYVSGLRFTEPNDRETNIYNLEVNWDAGFATVKSVTSYTTYDSDGRRDQTDLLLDLEPDDYYYYEEFPAFAAFTNDEQDDDVFTQEVRLVSNSEDSRLNWILGAFYQDSDFDSVSQEFTPGYAEWDPFFTTEFGDLEYDSKTTQDVEEKAIYGEIGYDFTDRLTATLGARWFDYDDELEACAAFPIFTTGFGGNPDVNAPENCQSGELPDSADDDDILFKFNAAYTFTDDLLGYATYSEGYSSATVNTTRLCDPDDPNDFGCVSEDEIYTDPEESKNYELGMKSQWFDNRLTVNGAVYYIDWDNTQVSGRTATGDFLITRDGGEAETKGLELELAAQLTEKITMNLSYAYTDAELADGCTVAEASSGLENCAIPDAETKSGDRLPGTPEHQGSVNLIYNTLVSNDMGLSLIYGLTSQSDVLTSIGDGDDCCRDNGEELGGFTLHYASAALSGDVNSGDEWNVSLFVDNLFDKYAVTGVREDRTKVTTAGGAPDFALRRYFQNVVRPRTIGVDLRYRFK